MSSQSIYVSLSILSLIGLAGAVRAPERAARGSGRCPRTVGPRFSRLTPPPAQGVAVGSGVAMMSMAALEHEAKVAPVAAHSVAEAKFGGRKPASRGFAAQ